MPSRCSPEAKKTINTYSPDRLTIRAAQVHDVPDIYELMLPFMANQTLIKRDKDDIFEHLQEFVVASHGDTILGVAALHIYSGNLAEVRSLVVSPAHQKHGIGQALVNKCEQLALEIGVGCIFALTYVDHFFIKQGYHVVNKESLPHKVWTVCIHCPKFSHCDEVAVKKDLR